MAHGGGQILMKTNKWCWRKGEKQENKNEGKALEDRNYDESKK